MIETLERSDVSTIARRKRKYGIVLYDDDVTPFDYVIAVLESVFGKSENEAFSDAQRAQENGKHVILQPITKDVGMSLVGLVDMSNMASGQFLKVTVEEI